MAAGLASRQTRPVDSLRVSLDTNLWSELALSDVVSRFDELARARRWQVVVPPAILLEVARTTDPDRRLRILRAITRRRRFHTLTEAQMEATELLEEVRRVRPAWVNRSPDTRSIRRLERFWKTGIWQAAAHRPEAFAEGAASADDGSVRSTLVGGQRTTAQAARRGDFRFDPADLYVDLRGSDVRLGLHPGASETRIEAWRVVNALLYWHQLVTPTFGRAAGRDTTLADWAAPHLRLEVVKRSRDEYNRFWYYDVRPEAMPRNWMRAAVHHAQINQKVTAGNPVDDQLSAYLFDCDVFITADRRFHRLLEVVRPASPIPFSQVALLNPASDDLVAALEHAIAEGR
jgi:hypothetical protein